MDGELLYTRVPDEELLWHPLGPVTLVYHVRSGITHIVMEPVPEILAAMGAGPIGAAAIAVNLAQRFDLPPTDANALIGARLAELETLGLIERAARRA